MHRVRTIALRIGRSEGADEFVVELAALLHEIADAKATGDEESGSKAVARWLRERSLDPCVVDTVAQIVADVPYRGAGIADARASAEGRCVRDADRLDAMGAIGIARTFAYGGMIGRAIHDPDTPAVLHATTRDYRSSMGTTVNHFAEKLLLLRDRMETELGRLLAEHRHVVMTDFLEELAREWASEL